MQVVAAVAFNRQSESIRFAKQFNSFFQSGNTLISLCQNSLSLSLLPVTFSIVLFRFLARCRVSNSTSRLAARMASVRRTFLPLVLLGMAALYGGPAFQAVQSQGWPMHAEFCITAGNEELHSCSLKAAGSRRPKPG